MNLNEISIEDLIIHFRDTYSEVYYTTIGEEDYIWRTLSRKEYRDIQEFARSQYDAYERICQKAVLFPERNFALTAPAYLPEQLAPQILNESGYGNEDKDGQLLKIFREQVNNNFEVQAQIIINRAFSYITFEDMETWTKEKLLKFVAKAEWALQFIEQKDYIHLMTADELRQQAIEMAEESGEDVEEEPEEEFDINDLARQERDNGRDPMFSLSHLYQKEKPAYFERPLIGGRNQSDNLIAGSGAWRRGGLEHGRYEVIREQVQKVSRR